LQKNRHAEVVYLNVYHVTSLNKAVELVGLGFYHTSIGIYNLELSYGGDDMDRPGTVVVYRGNSAGLQLKESIAVGRTYFDLDEINNITDYFG
jgi:PPPDE putative peptidase domain